MFKNFRVWTSLLMLATVVGLIAVVAGAVAKDVAGGVCLVLSVIFAILVAERILFAAYKNALPKTLSGGLVDRDAAKQPVDLRDGVSSPKHYEGSFATTTDANTVVPFLTPSALNGRSLVETDAIANADARLNDVGLPTYSTLLVALEKIWCSGHPDATDNMPEQRGISEAEFGQALVRIAGTALGRT